MNRQTKINSLNAINEKELELGITGNSGKSWHQDYKHSAWIYIGGLDYELNEGDLLSVFSQYGEIMNVNLIRDYKTLKSKGFAYICYKDQRSTTLAVDNFNGIKIAGRTIQVDHCKEFKPPRYKESIPPEILKMWEEGCAPKPINISKDEIARDVKKQEMIRDMAISKAEKILPMTESAEMKKAKKKMKKEMKKFKKREKRERERQRRSPTPVDERGTADDEGRWDQKKKKRKLVDYRKLKDDDFYGATDNFNFNKKRKELPTGPTHNIRPNFDKADWRDIELFKIMREKDAIEKGPKHVKVVKEDAYLPGRLGGDRR